MSSLRLRGGSVARRLIVAGCLLGAGAAGLLAADPPQAATGAPSPFFRFDAPFSYSYLAWQDKAGVADGHAAQIGRAHV